MLITLNGESFELDQPLSVEELLQRLEIDPRRVAVEHNLVILKRHAFAATLVGDGDRVEIVNFVGGGEPRSSVRRATQAPRHRGTLWQSLIPPSRSRAARSNRG